MNLGAGRPGQEAVNLIDVVRVSAALSNAKRYEILKTLYRGVLVSCCDRFHLGEQGACVSDVVSAFKMSQSTISHHLAVLEEAGLVRSEARGLYTCYFPNTAVIEEYLAALRAQLLDVEVPCCVTVQDGVPQEPGRKGK